MSTLYEHPISDELLIAYAAGELDAAASNGIENHLSTCAECTRTVDLYSQVQEVLRADDSTAPSAEAVARAQTLFTLQPTFDNTNWFQRLTGFFTPPRRLLAFPAPSAAVIAIVFLIMGWLLSPTISNALPGDALYPVKITVEGLKVAIAVDDASQVETQLAIAETRIKEMDALAAQKRYDEIPVLAFEYARHVEHATNQLNLVAAKNPAVHTQLATDVKRDLSQHSETLTQLTLASPASIKPAIAQAAIVSYAAQSAVQNQLTNAERAPTPTPSATPTLTPTQPATTTPQPKSTLDIVPSEKATATPTPDGRPSVVPTTTDPATPAATTTVTITVPSMTSTVSSPTVVIAATSTPLPTVIDPGSTPTPSPSASPTPSPTFLPTPTWTMSPAPSLAPTKSRQPTATPKPRKTKALEPSTATTVTSAATGTVTATLTLTTTPTSSPTATPTESTVPSLVPGARLDNGGSDPPSQLPLDTGQPDSNPTGTSCSQFSLACFAPFGSIELNVIVLPVWGSVIRWIQMTRRSSLSTRISQSRKI